MYWDDANVIVIQFKPFIASKGAGNASNENYHSEPIKRGQHYQGTNSRVKYTNW